MTRMERNPLALGRRARPTRRHHPVLWETMLAAVSARRRSTGDVEYFDHDWTSAVAALGIDPDRPETMDGLDLRVARVPAGISYATPSWRGPRAGQWALWALRPETVR